MAEKAIGQELSEDLMIEILVCLPVKSIIRFRCVSKTWCNMLKRPSFVNYHLRNKRRRNVLLVRRCMIPPQNDDVLSFHDPDSPELEEVCPNLSIPFSKDLHNKCGKPYLGPCNGIVCIFHYNFVILCNPALREFKALPRCPIPQACYDFNIIARGFGNTSTNAFKVVLLQIVDRKVFRKPHVMFNLYTSSTSSWKQIDGGGEINPIQVANVSGLPYTELFFNGACHWCASHPNYERAILSFDLSTEVSGWLEYPGISNRKSIWWSNLMVINECLAVVWHNYLEKEPIEIWVMKEYGVWESWTKHFVIRPLECFYPFFAWKNEWVLLHYCFEKSNNDQLVSCSLHTPNKIKNYQIYGENYTLSALIYQESLISLDQV